MPLYRLYLTEGEGKEEDKHKKKITKSLGLATSWGEIWRVFYERKQRLRPHGLWKGSNNSWGTSRGPWSILGLNKNQKTPGVEIPIKTRGFCWVWGRLDGSLKLNPFFSADPILPRHTWHTTESLVTMTSNQDKARQERAGYGDMKATYPKKTTVVIETLESAATIGDVFFFDWMSLMMFF